MLLLCCLNILKDNLGWSVAISEETGMDMERPVGMSMPSSRWAVTDASPGSVGSGQILGQIQVEVWREVWEKEEKRMTSWFLPWDKRKPGVFIYWDGVCRLQLWRGRLLFSYGIWVSLYIRYPSRDTEREVCWVKMHDSYLETNAHIVKQLETNLRFLQSVGFRSAWVISYAGLLSSTSLLLLSSSIL